MFVGGHKIAKNIIYRAPYSYHGEYSATVTMVDRSELEPKPQPEAKSLRACSATMRSCGTWIPRDIRKGIPRASVKRINTALL